MRHTTAADPRRPTALVVGISAMALFVVLRFVVASNGYDPLPMDVWWDDLVGEGDNAMLLVLAWIPGIVGGTLGMIVIGVLVVGVFWWRRKRADAATLAVSIVVVVALGAPMAAVLARNRPEDSLAESMATSFPSGHTAVATTFAVMLGLLLRRGYVWACGVVWVVWMMWSRTYLHAHWLSDVVAGMCEGIAVATLVWCASEVIRERRALRHRAPLDETEPPRQAPV
ncbi:phosphatase PAP2 family protein [Microbacterium sp. C7(2022)]|uniref:phosphatase PAP2 family protein n=1 Tax=Microbacterium sp. C7(2022) TaxID=2992759 RepID=UPI00237A0AC3|nr:phosphatase PAP2 family protein [Microbacterium sp. C7(2022)]MDE0546551.1 phosphatase PAP2 family protein [Microbacterium sp. C7(2022)]